MMYTVQLRQSNVKAETDSCLKKDGHRIEDRVRMRRYAAFASKNISPSRRCAAADPAAAGIYFNTAAGYRENQNI
jgi:hypothetical protein